MPPLASSASARSAFAISSDSRYSKTFVSKKTSAAGIRLAPVKIETGRQAMPGLAQPRDGPFAAAVATDFEPARPAGRDPGLVAFFQLKGFDDSLGRRTARLFPHFETCMVHILDIR